MALSAGYGALMTLAGAIGGLGLLSILQKKSLLNLFIGMQALFLGASLLLVMAGVVAERPLQGHVFALMVTLGGLAPLAVGFAFAVRLHQLVSPTEGVSTQLDVPAA